MGQLRAADGSIALSDADHCLARASWQRVLFAERPRRADLLSLQATWPCRPFHLHVLRNQPFEFIAGPLRSFAAYGGWDLEVSFGEYDDSLSDLQSDEADAVLVWLDFDRYGSPPADLVNWLVGRVADVRRITDVPILVANQAPAAPNSAAAELNLALTISLAKEPGVLVVDQAAIADELGTDYHDERASRITGFRLSGAACLETARRLGLSWLPAAGGAHVKAVIVDLDGTLYDGVLGEDGPHGICVRPWHQALGSVLLELRDRGIFLGLLSRNERRDVVELFDLRPDLPLRVQHFSAMAVSWEPKPDELRRLAERLRIGTESILVIDDNPGELAAIAADVTGVRCLWADREHPDGTARALHWYPGLRQVAATHTDRVRVADLAAADRRETERSESADPEAYVKSLQIELILAIDPVGTLTRLQELSAKTNQFNTTLRRMTEPELAQRMADPESRVVAAALRDRLSDSGTICGLVTHREVDRLVVDELAVSCRALGRGMETPLVLAALRRVLAELPAKEVLFPFTDGPRNGPARRWLTDVTGVDPIDRGESTMTWADKDAADCLAATPVAIRWEDKV